MSERKFLSRNARAALGTVVLLAAAAPAVAVDGVIEINHAKALAGAVTPGDVVGFPVSITQPGSYRVTSDLIPPSGITGIDISSDNVTVDLNGFTIFGSGEVGFNDGVIFSTSNVEIRNGTVRGFLRHGVFGITANATEARIIGVRAHGNFIDGIHLEGAASLIDGCTVSDNLLFGIQAGGDGSLVINSIARNNTQEGMQLGLRVGFRSNALTGNNGSNFNAQVSSGNELGTNICGNNTVCP